MSAESTASDITVYSPESPLRHPFKLVGQILGDFWKSRELIGILFLRDLKASYRQSYLGYLWIIFPPLVTAALWIYLSGSGLVKVGDTGIPRPAFVLIGTTLWTTFTAAFNAPMAGFIGGSAVFMKLKVPPEAFIASSIAKVIFDTCIRLLLLIPLFILYPVDLSPGWYSLLFPLALLSTILFGTALGYWLIPIGGLYADVGRAFGLIMPLLMYTAPVVFPLQDGAITAANEPTALVESAEAASSAEVKVAAAETPPLVSQTASTDSQAASPETAQAEEKSTLGKIAATVMRYNPVTPLIMAGRDWISIGYSPHGISVLLIGILSLPILMVGMVLLRVAMPHLVVRMGM